ncbi:putative transporter, partial [Lachnellula occidentalis]
QQFIQPESMEISTKDSTKMDIDSIDQKLGKVITTSAALEPLTAADDKGILRRIDLTLLPLLFISYMFQYLDKSAMGFTAILGLRTDLHLKGQEYSWAGSIFNFGYLVASGPVVLIMVRFPVGKFMAVAMYYCMGRFLMFTALTHNAAGLLACRFFLGFLESAVAPGFSIITSMWYKRSEQPLRHGIWFLGNVVSGLFGSSLAYGMSHYKAFPAWKFLFLIFGGVTVLWGIVLFFFLPDSPVNARFLSKEDKSKAVRRVQENLTGTKDDKWKMYQMIEAFQDPKAWLIVIIMLCTNIPNGGVGNFASIVIQGFGFSTTDTLLVQMIVTPFQAFFVLSATITSSYVKNTRTICMTLCALISLAGACCIRQLDNSNIWARYLSGYCLLSAYTANFPMILSMNTSKFGGFTKKTTVHAMASAPDFVSYCVGNIVGPQLFFAREAPGYKSGFLGMLFFMQEYGVRI